MTSSSPFEGNFAQALHGVFLCKVCLYLARTSFSSRDMQIMISMIPSHRP